ncbi:MAG: glutamate-5-semialdehyde dehydrogenase [Oscillospiraceae bacterium]|nr:glutamate-5-semialdehyde dehydrogenase [Oscillospiraceae bacterium]
MNEILEKIGTKAKSAETLMAAASSATKNGALKEIAAALLENSDDIISANGKDLENADKNGMTAAMKERLMLNSERIEGIAKAVGEITALPDPVGKVTGGGALPNGLKLTKITVPLGVIAIIYESRPNVTADAAALALKSGNAVILKGGQEAINSNIAIVNIIRAAIAKTGLPEDAVSLLEDCSRETAAELMKLNKYVDVLIPRGGAGLINAVVQNSTVPVIETGAGNCHVYVDESADIEMAADIVFNAKTSRPSVCNACETLLLHKGIAETALIRIKERLDEKNVEIRGDEAVCAVIPGCTPAVDDDFYTEYSDYIIAAKVVASPDEAIAHINKYSTKHSDAIVTEDYASAEKFAQGVDSAAVYINASTRFTDGGVFGFGAEIGISTQKLHARGPVGLPELVSYKYIIRGNGQVRL